MKKDKSLIVHIGLPKTGTTFLQNVIFPKTDCTGFMSHEGFTGNILDGDVCEFYSQMEGLRYQYDIKRIIFVRREKKSFIRSVYNQYVKEGGTKVFEDWWYHVFDHRFVDFDDMEHYLGGIAQVVVMDYEHLVSDVHDFVSLFCRYAEIREPVYTPVKYNVSWSKKKIEAMRLLNCMFFWYPGWLKWCFPDQYPPRWLLTKDKRVHRWSF